MDAPRLKSFCNDRLGIRLTDLSMQAVDSDRMSVHKLPTFSIQMPSGDHWVHALSRPLTSIGRVTSNDIVLPDERVSRFHATVMIDHAFVMVEDLRSRNGILLNGRLVTHEALTNGDTLVIGGCTLRFLWEDDSNVRIEAEDVSPVPGWRFTTRDDSQDADK